MSKNVQTFPVGLQSLLQVKGNLSPLDLNENIQLTLETFPFLALQRQETQAFANVANAAVGTVIFAETVPPGEIWYVWHLSVAITLAVGNTLKGAPALIPQGATGTFPLTSPQSYVASEVVRANANGPFILQAGQSLGFHCGIITGAAMNFGGAALITRLKY